MFCVCDPNGPYSVPGGQTLNQLTPLGCVKITIDDPVVTAPPTILVRALP